MISNGELSDPLCDSVNKGPTLVRLGQSTDMNVSISLCETVTMSNNPDIIIIKLE